MRRLLISILILLSSMILPHHQSAHADSGHLIPAAEFTDVTFNCPNEITFDIQINLSYAYYIRAYDTATDALVYENDLGYRSSPDTFADSFALPEPLPATIELEVWAYTVPVFHIDHATRSSGWASLFQPPILLSDLGTGSGPPLPGYLASPFLTASRTIITPDCESLDACPVSVPIYGTALVTKPQVMYSAPNGEVVKDENGVPLPLLHDVDGDGADTYLIIDIATGAEGETWLGLFIGACDPVYVELQNVFPLGAIPVD